MGSLEKLLADIGARSEKDCIIIEDDEKIMYQGKLPNGNYGIAVQSKFVQNIYRKLRKTPARLAEEWK